MRVLRPLKRNRTPWRWLGLVLALVLLLMVRPTRSKSNSKPANAVLLSDIQTLTLRAGKKTTHRRVSAAPQLKCIGGSGRNHYEIDVLRCENAGSDYDDANVQWTCKASLPSEFKLGSTDVICEGYANSDDPYVLKGSCGVEYRLVLTEQGEEKYGKSGSGSWFGSTKTKSKTGSKKETKIDEATDGSFIYTMLVRAFWIAIVLFFVAAIYSRWPRSNRTPRAPRTTRRWGGGGGDGGGNDPPPPYASYYDQPHYSKTPYFGGNGSGGGGESWRPGFWTGTAAGYAAGNYMGGRNNNSNSSSSSRSRPNTSSWFGGGNSNSNSGGGESSSSSSSTPSSSRYESTGFGESRRR